VLREYLIAHRLRQGRTEGLLFGAGRERPFTPSAVARRASTAWRRPGLTPIALHEARHTFASLAIAAGLNAKALSVYMGHASVAFTLDRCDHHFPGNEEEAADLLDAYLSKGPVRQSRGSAAPRQADSGGLERRSGTTRRSRRKPSLRAIRPQKPHPNRCPREDSNLRHQV